MAFSRYAQALLFSLAIHGLIIGGSLFLAREQNMKTDRVYRVALADFVQPVQEQPVLPPQPAPVQPEPEVPPPPPEEPGKVEPVQEVVKKISPKKSAKKPADPKPVKPAPPPPSPAPAVTGPQARNIGGISAYDSDKLDQRPRITKRAAPEYPIRARRMNIEGRVIVQVIVDKQGMPVNEKITRATPAGYFEDVSLAAVKRMRFSPGKLKGQVVNTIVVIPFEFKLR